MARFGESLAAAILFIDFKMAKWVRYTSSCVCVSVFFFSNFILINVFLMPFVEDHR